MSYHRAHGDVTIERLCNWYLTMKTFPMSEEQLMEIARGMQKPYRRKKNNWSGKIPEPVIQMKYAILAKLQAEAKVKQ